MARMPRVVVPNFPHHVTQRGSRRQVTFFSDDDYRTYIDLVAEAKLKAGVDIWAYCLMPNHVHLVAVPRDEESLATLFANAHRRYTLRINTREGWQGHLWQERFHSIVMDETHLIAAVRYVENNPVRASLCERPEDWPWSSTRAHLQSRDDRLVMVAPMLELVDDWSAYLSVDQDDDAVDSIRLHTRTGRPVGSNEFITMLENITGRNLHKRKPGPRRS